MTKKYKNLFPWQRITKKNNLLLCFKFDKSFDVVELRKDFYSCINRLAPKTQYDVYHDGGWGGICLHSIDGDPENDMGGKGTYKYTPLIQEAPYIKKIIDAIPGNKERVRILTKKPQTRVYWHTDENETFDKNFVRLHIPIETNDNYEFQISHENCSWEPGELWYGDFSFPHRLRNLDTKKINAHLVIDLRLNKESFKFLGNDFCEAQLNQQDKRRKLRKICNSYYYFYNLLFDLKRYRIIFIRKLKNIFPKWIY